MHRYTAAVITVGISTGLMGQPRQKPAVLVMPPQSVDCPVGLFAQRHSVAAMASAGGQVPAPGRQSLWIGLWRRDTAQPVAATGKLHGMAIGPHAMNVSGAEGAEASEHFDLELKRTDKVLRRAVVEPRLLAGVSWIELTEIRFLDGTAWHSSQGSRCIAEPSGMMLIDGE